MFDVIIVGAGFAGSVLAERLASQKNKSVLVIERRNHIGGNCFDERDDNGILIHKYGPHLFHTDDEEVWKYLSQFTDWHVYHHHVLAMIDGQIVPLPFNLNTLHKLFPTPLANKLETALLNRYDYNTKVPILKLKQSTDKDLRYLADYVYEKIFLHYTEKQWNLSPENIEGAVTARVPVFVGRDDRYFNDRFQAVPTKGYTAIFKNMLNHKNIKLMLNTKFSDVMKIDDGKILFLDQPFNGQVIYTGQLDDLFDEKFGALPYRSVEMKFETVATDNYQPAATVNYPNNYDFTRITEFKKIHPSNSAVTTILKEYPQDYERGKNTPYYPIFTDENKSRYEQYAAEVNKISNLTAVGRLAEYRYYDMDDIVKRALDVFKTFSNS
ncbi:MAG: UDP-galactopyranose mutase [Selenomonadaceae bacterium]|nr:UDP-galactopyranose mutase [Selenomonadaceae bacterium]MBR1860200.1 UDP-galactopyranose mutase [Selenomonadaceae bacterium]